MSYGDACEVFQQRTHSFHFKECITLFKATGVKACNLGELRKGIASVSESSLVHHTYGHFLRSEVLHYTNDFAEWAADSLEEQALAEHLSTLDPYDYCEISALRRGLLERIDRYLADFPSPRNALPGREFFFSENILISYPVGVRARNLAEFIIALRYVDARSIYYHFYDARTRLKDGRNDFSVWLEETLEKTELAAQIARIDPFMRPLEGIRAIITAAVEDELRREMEGMAP